MLYLSKHSSDGIVEDEIRMKMKRLASEVTDKFKIIEYYISSAFIDKIDATKECPFPTGGEMIDNDKHAIDVYTKLLEFLEKIYMILQHVNHRKLFELEYYVKLLDTMLELGA